MKTLVAWQGGKARQAKWIASVVDSIPHKCYVEPFSGPASIFFAKKKSKIEILNDKDKRFPLIFQALRDCPHEMVKFLKLIEYSRASWDESKKILAGAPLKEPYKLGAWALYNIFGSHAGGLPTPGNFSWARFGAKRKSQATHWREKIKQIEEDLPLHKLGAWALYNIFGSHAGEGLRHGWARFGAKRKSQATHWREKIKQIEEDLPLHKLGAWALYNIFGTHAASPIPGKKGFKWVGRNFAAEWKKRIKEIEDGLPLHKLGAWSLYNIFATHAGVADAHCHAWARATVERKSQATHWREKIKQMGGFCRRLKDAIILNHDVFKLLKTIGDRDNVLIYVDPPYVTTNHTYACGDFTLEDHEKLASILNSYEKTRVILSHYDIEPYTTWYKDWEIQTKASIKACDPGRTKCVEALFIKR